MGTLTNTFAQVQDAIDQQYDGDQERGSRTEYTK